MSWAEAFFTAFLIVTPVVVMHHMSYVLDKHWRKKK